MTSVLDAVLPYLQKAKKSGPDNLMAKCPFHRRADGSLEHIGSFAINIRDGLWCCHSCHAAGNLYTFLRDVGVPREEISARYSDALDAAARATPTRADPLNPVAPTKEFLDESFLGLFDYCPQLMLDEGFPESLLRDFDVGFDMQHSRITFPLRDFAGRLVGISGRTIFDIRPRYKVYDKEYLVWGLNERATEKRALLWNAHRVRAHLRNCVDPSSRYIIVVEGFKACMRVAQAGVRNVVALLGSSVSDEQLWILESFGVPVHLMLDNNEAGQLGTLKAAKKLMKSNPSVNVLAYDAEQPSDLSEEQVIESFLNTTPFPLWFTKNVAALIAAGQL